MYTMNKLRKNLKNKKGFTLVEVIVVIVIIAILAAIMLPSLTGYIDEANGKAAILEARNVYAALQTTASLEYASGNKLGYFTTADGKTSLSTDGAKKINALMGVTGTNEYAVGEITNLEMGNANTITAFRVATKAGQLVSFSNGVYEIANP